MPCNVTKCNELCTQKRSKESYRPVNDIKQVQSLKILGITFQNNSRFTVHIKNKLLEANKCLFVIRSLKKEGYCQDDIDHLFNVIVLPKLTYGLSVYAASKPELTTVQNFLNRCYKRKYISYFIDIFKLLDKSDRTIFNKARNVGHPLHSVLPKVKESSLRLRNTSSLLPRINTERFKSSFVNRLFFKHNLFIK